MALTAPARPLLNIPDDLKVPESVAEPFEAYRRLQQRTREAESSHNKLQAMTQQVEQDDNAAHAAAIQAGTKPPKPKLDAHRATVDRAQRDAVAYRTAFAHAHDALVAAIVAARDEWIDTASADAETAREAYLGAVATMREQLHALSFARTVVSWLDKFDPDHNRTMFRLKQPHAPRLWEVLDAFGESDQPDTRGLNKPEPLPPVVVDGNPGPVYAGNGMWTGG